MKITLNDIAQHAGVSRSLVSFYLGNPGTTRVAEKTRARIDLAVRELGYRRNEAARSLRMGKSKTIGLLTGDITRPGQAFLIQTLMNALKQRGYRLSLEISAGDPEELQSALRGMLACQMDGIICELPFDEKSPAAQSLEETHY